MTTEAELVEAFRSENNDVASKISRFTSLDIFRSEKSEELMAEIIKAQYLANKPVELGDMEKFPELFHVEEDGLLSSKLDKNWLDHKYPQGFPNGFKFADYDSDGMKMCGSIFDENEFMASLNKLKDRGWKSSAKEMKDWYGLSCGIAATNLTLDKMKERLDEMGGDDENLNEG